MRGALAAAATLALLTCACAPKGPEGVDTALLDEQVGRAIGDPSTCVLLAERDGGKVVYRYGTNMTCARTLPACQGAGTLTIDALKDAAAKGDERAISCPSLPDGSAMVGWAAGPVQAAPGAKYGDLVYAAVMEGERALPGREIKSRLESALTRAGM